MASRIAGVRIQPEVGKTGNRGIRIELKRERGQFLQKPVHTHLLNGLSLESSIEASRLVSEMRLQKSQQEPAQAAGEPEERTESNAQEDELAELLRPREAEEHWD